MPAVPELLRRLPPPRGIGTLLFAAAAATTIAGSLSMQGMGALPMPGGWALSTAWMPMCGQSWSETAASFTGMWVVMMVAMMLPALLPVLRQHRPGPAALAAAAYFLVWTVLGLIVFAVGAALAQVLLQMNTVARAVPALSGLAVLLAGAFQFSAAKAHHLACCRQQPMEAGAAWRHGLRLGRHCVYSCAGLTLSLLVMGVMDLRAMLLVTAAISAERLAPDGRRVARVVGALACAAGLLVTARLAWPA